MQLHALVPLFEILYTHVCKNFSSCGLKFPGKNCRQIYGNQKQACGGIEAQLPLPKVVRKILCCVALVYISYFSQNSRFTEIIITITQFLNLIGYQLP